MRESNISNNMHLALIMAKSRIKAEYSSPILILLHQCEQLLVMLPYVVLFLFISGTTRPEILYFLLSGILPWVYFAGGVSSSANWLARSKSLIVCLPMPLWVILLEAMLVSIMKSISILVLIVILACANRAVNEVLLSGEIFILIISHHI